MAGAATFALAGCGSGAVAMRPSHTANATGTPRDHITCKDRTGFELSLARDRGGQPTPVAAAVWFARHGGIGGVIPQSGWRLTQKNQDGATVTSDQSAVHAIQRSDGTWQVDSGTTCALAG